MQAEAEKVVPASARIAELDNLRDLYGRILSLLRGRERALEAEASALLRASRPAKPDACWTVLRSALHHDPLHHAPDCSLLRPPPSSSSIEPSREALFGRLAQLDVAIAALQVITAAETKGAEPSNLTVDPAAVLSDGVVQRVSSLGEFAGADSELRHHLNLATAGVRSSLALCGHPCGSDNANRRHEGGGVMQQDPDASYADGGLLMPLGTSFIRPYLSLPTRKRLRDGHAEASTATSAAYTQRMAVPGAVHTTPPSEAPDMATHDDRDRATTTLAFRLPLGALGATGALSLRDGDVLHVPFTCAEASILAATMARHQQPPAKSVAGVPTVNSPLAPSLPAATRIRRSS